MSYKRKIVDKPQGQNQLEMAFGHYGQLDSMQHDQGWIYERLKELHEDGAFSLSQFFGVAQSVKTMDVSEFKKHIADQKKAEPIIKGRKALLTFLKKHITTAEDAVTAVQNKILRVTQPDEPSDPVAKMVQFMKEAEIRNNLKQIEPKLRQNAIRGNLTRIQAVLSNPDPSDIIVADSALTEMRREYAFQSDPSLIDEETDHIEIYKAVRGRSAEINSTSIKILMDAGLKDDPLPPSEHFETFPPQNDYEKHIAEKRIAAYQREQDRIAKDKAFEEKNQGIDLEVADRKKRHRQ